MAKKSVYFNNINIFVVQPQKGPSKKDNVWEILNPGGVCLATMVHTPDSIWTKFLRKIGFAAQYGTRIEIINADGTPSMAIRKSFSLGMFKAYARDTQGRMGYVREEKLGFDGRKYLIYDWEGKHRGQLEGDWRAYSLQIKDPSGATLGVISRKNQEINKVIFRDKDPYYVVHLYIDQEDLRWRHLLLGVSASVSLLLR